MGCNSLNITLKWIYIFIMLLLNGVKKELKCIFLNKLLIIKDIFKLKNCKVSIILILYTPPKDIYIVINLVI